jgi:uncharacterized repeat protein (TIGR01451 family)
LLLLESSIPVKVKKGIHLQGNPDMRSNRRVIVFVLFIILNFGLGQARAESDIDLNMVAQKEIVTIDVQGKKMVTLMEPTTVIPGDVIVYTTHYHNKGKMSAEKVAITNPIPKDTAYVDGSGVVDNAILSYSVDGGKSFDVPEKLTITESNGRKRPATADNYSHIRWTLKSIAPDTRGSVSFHARVR